MTKTEAMRHIATLRGAWPRGDFPAESATVYATFIMDLSSDTVGKVIGSLVCRSRFLPSIAEIRECVAEATCSLPSSTDAWGEIERALRKYDGNDSSTWTYPDDFSHPLITEALRLIGGLPRLDTTNTFSTDRREFLRLYAEMRQSHVHKEQVRLPSTEQPQIGAGNP